MLRLHHQKFPFFFFGLCICIFIYIHIIYNIYTNDALENIGIICALFLNTKVAGFFFILHIQCTRWARWWCVCWWFTFFFYFSIEHNKFDVCAYFSYISLAWRRQWSGGGGKQLLYYTSVAVRTNRQRANIIVLARR